MRNLVKRRMAIRRRRELRGTSFSLSLSHRRSVLFLFLFWQRLHYTLASRSGEVEKLRLSLVQTTMRGGWREKKEDGCCRTYIHFCLRHFLAVGEWWMVITYTVVHFGTSHHYLLSSLVGVGGGHAMLFAPCRRPDPFVNWLCDFHSTSSSSSPKNGRPFCKHRFDAIRDNRKRMQ